MCWPNLKLAYVIFNVNKILCFYNLIFFRTCLIPENKENKKLRRTDMDNNKIINNNNYPFKYYP